MRIFFFLLFEKKEISNHFFDLHVSASENVQWYLLYFSFDQNHYSCANSFNHEYEYLFFRFHVPRVDSILHICGIHIVAGSNLRYSYIYVLVYYLQFASKSKLSQTA